MILTRFLWVVIGDFNEILNSGEKKDGPLRPERQMDGFREALGYGDRSS